MEFKEIKGTKHYLYEDELEFNALNPGNVVVGNWRKGEVGDWVYTDDDFVCQVIGKSKLKHPGYKELRTVIRTVCGSFVVQQKTHQMLGDNGIAQNIYAFSGNYDSIYDRQNNRKLNKFLDSWYNINPKHFNNYHKQYNGKSLKMIGGLINNRNKNLELIDAIVFDMLGNPKVSETREATGSLTLLNLSSGIQIIAGTARPKPGSARPKTIIQEAGSVPKKDRPISTNISRRTPNFAQRKKRI